MKRVAVVLVIIIAAGCGTITELSADGGIGGGPGGSVGRGDSGIDLIGVGHDGGSGSVAVGGVGGGGGTAGAAGNALAGSGGAGGARGGAGGAAGSAAGGGGAGGAPPPPPCDGLLAKACGSSGCHGVDQAGGLDLVSPWVADRLLGVRSQGANGSKCGGNTEPYLITGSDPAQGLLIDKVFSAPPCGDPMPGMGVTLSPTDAACLRAWALSVTTGPR